LAATAVILLLAAVEQRLKIAERLKTGATRTGCCTGSPR
jgi:hypothetical protein